MLYHVKVSGDSLNDFRTAYANATAKVIENDTFEMVIAVDDINSLDSFVFPVLYGITTKLKKFGVVDIANIKVFLETKINKSKFTSGVIIASYVTDGYLGEILADSRATDTVFVTDINDKLKKYLSHNNSAELI